MKRTISSRTVFLRSRLATAQRLLLAALCGLLLVSSALAQEPLPAPEQPTPEASPTPKPADPNETLTPVMPANQNVDGDLVFSSPGQFPYPRDIRLSDNFGGLRFYGANSLTTTPAGAAIQFFGNNASPFNGQLYLDSGAFDSAALIFRTAPTGGTITERMRVRSDGNVGIGTTDTQTGKLRVLTGSTGTPQFAVIGESTAPFGIGVIGASPRYGVLGSTIAGIGVQGQADTGFGVVGNTNSGKGVYGQSTAGGIGVHGQSNGIAVFGDSTSNRGVYGRSNSNFGVFGESNSDAGVYGVSSSGTGVIGESASGNAGSFYGRVQVFGQLTKSSGSFKIDHPLDPQNKYLSHSFVESPDMMNIYNGNVTTDARGRAVVALPAYFTALNRDYRYQLTVVGQFAQAIVGSEVRQNRFTIKTNKPGVKVSWQVTGIRQDAYAEKHRIPVEEDKPAAERGTYLNPEAFGQPAEKGVSRARHTASTPQPEGETGKETLALKRTATGRQ